ncbi:mucin-5AC [Apis florea]|uniref:mucin-5AC n=1 Tax=Apis florea TaxID=7463 RepID=UPI0006298113|nr:mucin-5AC [Apis florea]
MKSTVRAAIWLAVGCMALPPQLQADPMSSGKMKYRRAKAPSYFNEEETSSSMIASSSNGGVDENSIGPTTIGNVAKISNGGKSHVDSIITNPIPPRGIAATINSGSITTLLSSSSSSSSLPSTVTTSLFTSTSAAPMSLSTSHGPSSSAELASPTGGGLLSSASTLSTAEARTELGAPSTGNRGATSTTTARTTTTARISTMAINTSSSNLTTFPTEASSRTIASNRDASTFLPSSKKSTTSFNEITTTPASTSSKEMRESTGKIRPQIKLTMNYTNLGETGVRLPEGASAALAKPTKYHYYPHNQHIYLLPECAVQQVCNAVYVRLNFTQPLCACPGRYRDPCSASLDSDDLHTTELVTDPRTKALTLVKTCEPVAEMRECRIPRDWSLLALQNVRTGKSHYLVICRCPDANILEGPMSHDQPTYASVPGIRVYGMMCVQGNRKGRPLRYKRSVSDDFHREIDEESAAYREETSERLKFPWYKVRQLMDSIIWD